MTAAFVIEEFVRVERNTLRGFVRVRTPSGLVFHDCGVHRQGDSVWVAPASKARIGRDGTQLKDATGKLLWSPVVTFATNELRAKFSAAVADALRLSHPEVFA